MLAKRQWKRAYRHVVCPQLWKQLIRRSSVVTPEGIPLSPRATPAKNRIKFTAHMSITEKTEDETSPSTFVFDPDGNILFYWTGLVSLVTIYNCWIIILRMAFPEVRTESIADILYYLDTLSDFVFLCDVTVHMRTAYLQDGIPVYDAGKIRQHYTSEPQFLRDVIGVLPIGTVASIIPSVGEIICANGAARLTRLLKLPVVYKFYDLADSRTSNPNGIRACRLTLSLVTVIHWIGCLYYMVSEFEGLGSNNWVYTNNSTKQRLTRKYVVCLYWSAMTLTTIGDCNPPETDLEYAFTGLTFLIGVFIFATVVGNVGDVISNMNATRQEFQSKMDQIKLYLTHRKVPATLQMKVKKWAEYSWSRTQATDEYRLLHMLPERLRAEIAVHVHLDTLRKVKIFENCEHEFLCELVLKLRSQIYSPGDYICRAGEVGREMYIINHGKVEVVVVNSTVGSQVVVAVLSEGNYFGEISLLRLEGVPNRRTADVRSVGYAELLCLSRRDLMTALVEYPEAKAVLEAQARERIKTNLQAKRTFSLDTLMDSVEEQDTLRFLQEYSRPKESEEKWKDIKDIRSMIETLHFIQNEAPQMKIQELQMQCEELRNLLDEKETTLSEARYRINELEDLLKLPPSRSLPQPTRLQTSLSLESTFRHRKKANAFVCKSASHGDIGLQGGRCFTPKEVYPQIVVNTPVDEEAVHRMVLRRCYSLNHETLSYLLDAPHKSRINSMSSICSETSFPSRQSSLPSDLNTASNSESDSDYDNM